MERAQVIIYTLFILLGIGVGFLIGYLTGAASSIVG